MFDYKSIVSNELLTADFERVSSEELKCVDKVNGLELGKILKDTEGNVTGSDDFVQSQYNFWISRPERKVGQLVNIEGRTLDQLMTMYEQLLVGAYLLRFPETKIDPDNSQYSKMIDWLRSTDFYRAPASTMYHESMIGGLLVHSLKVYNEAILLNRLPKFRSVSIASVAIAALTHDWCKISTYESYKRNVKNEETGQWEQVDSFRRNLTGFTLGHGVTSIYYVMKFMDLNEGEIAAIRWHQGRWHVCEELINELQRCNEIYPLVHLIQFADQLAIVQY